ncbi:MAG: STAS domain-containing protein [Lentisphaeria bacterium]|nr:STAS domain-containing protein [Lentisphaeria bacterium]
MLSFSKKNDIGIIKVNNEQLDADTVDLFRKQIPNHINDHHQYILDMKSVNFIDSSGLGALLHLHRTFEFKGCKMKVVINEPQVLSIFRLVKITEVLDIYPSIKDAIDDFE